MDINLNIRVLIVDDIDKNALRIERHIQQYVSKLKVNYVTKIISGDNHKNEAIEFFELRQSEVDIVFVDHNLGKIKGLNLLKKIEIKRFQIYRVLHSIADLSFIETRYESEHRDDICSIGRKDQVKQVLEHYEMYILKCMLEGHPQFREFYWFPMRERPKALQPILSTNYLNCMYIKTNEDSSSKYFVYYRNWNTLSIGEDKDTKPFTFEEILKSNDHGLCYVSVNRSLLINLLWVSGISDDRTIIRFIPISNHIIELPVERPSEAFKKQILPFIEKINQLPRFFKR